MSETPATSPAARATVAVAGAGALVTTRSVRSKAPETARTATTSATAAAPRTRKNRFERRLEFMATHPSGVRLTARKTFLRRSSTPRAPRRPPSGHLGGQPVEVGGRPAVVVDLVRDRPRADPDQVVRAARDVAVVGPEHEAEAVAAQHLQGHPRHGRVEAAAERVAVLELHPAGGRVAPREGLDGPRGGARRGVVRTHLAPGPPRGPEEAVDEERAEDHDEGDRPHEAVERHPEGERDAERDERDDGGSGQRAAADGPPAP